MITRSKGSSSIARRAGSSRFSCPALESQTNSSPFRSVKASPKTITRCFGNQIGVSGIVMTMFDARTKLADQVIDEVRAYFGSRVYDTVIPRTVRLSEAPGFGKPISLYDPSSKGAMAYRWLAEEVVARPADESGLDVEPAGPDMVLGGAPLSTGDPSQGGYDS